MLRVCVQMALDDFRARICKYEEVYETITNRDLHYIKLIDMCAVFMFHQTDCAAPHHRQFKWSLACDDDSSARSCEMRSKCISKSMCAAVCSTVCAALCYRVTGKGYMDVNRISGYIPGKIVFFLMLVRFCNLGAPASAGQCSYEHPAGLGSCVRTLLSPCFLL